MKYKLVIFALLLTLGGGVLIAPSEGYAAESTSFILQEETTWVPLPSASTHFQLVSGLPSVSSSSSNSSLSVSSASSASEASDAQGGGRRSGGEEPDPSASSAPSETSSRSSIQSIPSSAPFKPSPSQTDHVPQTPSLHLRADHGTAAAYQSLQGSDRIVEQETPSSRSSDAYSYGDNCRLSESPVRNAASSDKEVVCVYRLYLVKLPDISLLRTWGGTELILHLTDILLIILGFLLILLAGVFHKRQRSRKQQRPPHRQHKHSSRVFHRK